MNELPATSASQGSALVKERVRPFPIRLGIGLTKYTFQKLTAISLGDLWLIECVAIIGSQILFSTGTLPGIVCLFMFGLPTVLLTIKLAPFVRDVAVIFLEALGPLRKYIADAVTKIISDINSNIPRK